MQMKWIKCILIITSILLISIVFMFFFSLGPFAKNNFCYILPIKLDRDGNENSGYMIIPKDDGYDFFIVFKRDPNEVLNWEEKMNYHKIVTGDTGKPYTAEPVKVHVTLIDSQNQIIYDRTLEALSKISTNSHGGLTLENNWYSADYRHFSNINQLSKGSYKVKIRVIGSNEKFKSIDTYLYIFSWKQKI